jgi:atlastin
MYSYALPLSVAFAAFILRWIADMTCSPYSQICRTSSEFLSHIYAVVIIFLLIVGATKAKQIKDLINKVKAAFEMMNSDGGKQKKD